MHGNCSRQTLSEAAYGLSVERRSIAHVDLHGHKVGRPDEQDVLTGAGLTGTGHML